LKSDSDQEGGEHRGRQRRYLDHNDSPGRQMIAAIDRLGGSDAQLAKFRHVTK